HALGSLVRIHHGQATALALEALLPWLVEHADPSFAAAARALGGAEEAKALPDVYSALMRAVGIAPKMPRDLAPISSAALAAAMTTPANAPMMAASPRPLSPGDIPELASRVLALQERAEVLA
ncbi:MAG: iron-containing alcohol dehydrogenase, partial [Pseudomonadota bacterium]